MNWRLAAASFLVALGTGTPVRPNSVPEPEGFRGEPYRAPVPATLTGARVIDAAEAIRLHAEGAAVFLDILPRKARPEGLPEGTIWREPPHETIPGALWLWNTGYQRLAPEEEARLRAGLRQARRDYPGRPVVFFCRSECWMSWNAAKRALEWGEQNIIWFPGGIEAWEAAGGPPLTEVEPFVL